MQSINLQQLVKRRQFFDNYANTYITNTIIVIAAIVSSSIIVIDFRRSKNKIDYLRRNYKYYALGVTAAIVFVSYFDYYLPLKIRILKRQV
jgi:hypothetical protein